MLFQPGKAEVLVDWLAAHREIKVVVITIAVRSLFALGPFSSLSLEELPKNPNYQVAFDGLDLTIKHLMAADKKVIMTVDNPTLLEPRICVQRKSVIPGFNNLFDKNRKRGCSLSLDKHLDYTGQYRRLIDHLKKENPDLIVYDPTRLFCDMQKKECSFMKDGKLMYSYSDHMSTYAASLLARELLPIVDHIAQGKGI